MTNLLPQSEQAVIRRERKLRFVALILFGASLVFLSGVLVLAPLIVGLRGRERAYTDLLTFTTGVNKEKSMSPEDGKAALEHVNEQISLFSDLRNASSVDRIFRQFTMLAGEDIRLRAFLYTASKKTAEGSEPWTVELRGTARTRDSLTTFERRLETDILVARADIPLEHFTEDRNIDFSVTIIGSPEH